MTDPIAAVRAFFDGLDTPVLETAAKNLAASVTDDFVWENSGLPALNGRDAAASFLLSMGQKMPMAGLKVDYIAIAAAGSTVVTERIDHLVDAAGSSLLSLPLAGTLEVADDGRISAWRDYFDRVHCSKADLRPHQRKTITARVERTVVRGHSGALRGLLVCST